MNRQGIAVACRSRQHIVCVTICGGKSSQTSSASAIAYQSAEFHWQGRFEGHFTAARCCLFLLAATVLAFPSREAYFDGARTSQKFVTTCDISPGSETSTLQADGERKERSR
jgi:hypothetical protein